MDQRDPDPGAQSGEDDQAALAARGAVPRLGQARGVRVVDDVDLPLEGLGEDRGVLAGPGDGFAVMATIEATRRSAELGGVEVTVEPVAGAR